MGPIHLLEKVIRIFKYRKMLNNLDLECSYMHWQMSQLSKTIPNFPAKTNAFSNETLNYTLQYIKYLQNIQLAYNHVCDHFKVEKHIEFVPRSLQSRKRKNKQHLEDLKSILLQEAIS